MISVIFISLGIDENVPLTTIKCRFERIICTLLGDVSKIKGISLFYRISFPFYLHLSLERVKFVGEAELIDFGS